MRWYWIPFWSKKASLMGDVCTKPCMDRVWETCGRTRVLSWEHPDPGSHHGWSTESKENMVGNEVERQQNSRVHSTCGHEKDFRYFFECNGTHWQLLIRGTSKSDSPFHRVILAATEEWRQEHQSFNNPGRRWCFSLKWWYVWKEVTCKIHLDTCSNRTCCWSG